MATPAIERGFPGGHGSHWDAVLEDPGQLGQVLRAAFREGTTAEWTQAALGGERPRIRERVLPFGSEGFEALLVEFEQSSRGKPGVATAYPHMRAAGAPLALAPKRIIEWGQGLEAQVEGQLPSGGALTFFATDYFHRAPDYQSGAPLHVALSAVAYTLGAISPEPRFQEVEGRRVDVSGASLVAPLKDSDLAPYYDDDFFLQGRVTRLRPFAFPPWDEGAVVELELPDLGKVPVFGRKKHFPHGYPRLGEMVAAYSWVQGRAAPAPGS